MTTPADQYYTALSEQYGSTIRQLVPHYDDMVDHILSLLQLFAPHRILDLGTGDGTLARRMLEELPEATVVGIEACDSMARIARVELAGFGARCRVVQQDIRAFEPAGRFDAIYSNLVLHNVRSGDKKALLRRMITWLEPHGVFVWGDLITVPEPRLQKYFVAQRVAFALAQGCPERTVKLNFAKEAEDDHPWDIGEMLRTTERTGFVAPQCVWCHDTFAIVVARGAAGACNFTR